MTVPADTNILADRKSTAKIKAKLKAGYKVKADFLEGGWYAVFRLDEKDRNKKKALGYVAAPRLKAVTQPLPPKVKTAGAKFAVDQPAPPKEGTAGAKFVVDLTVPAKASTAEAKAAVEPTPKANKAEPKALADQLLPKKANAVGEKAPSDQPQTPEANKVEGKAAAVTSVPDSGDEGIVLRDITFKFGPRGHEKVFIALNRQATPTLSSIQDASPRVVADFKNVVSVRPGLQNIPVDGSLIKRIRSSFDPATRILRIVLDLDPSKNYLVNQVFSQAENIYAFDLSEDPQAQSP